MAGQIRYEIKNTSSLKSHTQELMNKTAIGLGFETARKSIHIKIRFKKGASHKSWNSGKIEASQELAMWLVKGFKAGKGHKRVPGRPVFDQYLNFHGDEIRNRCIQVFNTYSHYSVRDRALIAGKEILRDLKRRIYNGSFYLAPNSGRYLKEKLDYFGGDIPLVATKALFEDLEVVVE